MHSNVTKGRQMNAKSDGMAGGNGKSRILVVDDHQLIREGLARIISLQADMVCSGEAAYAEAALSFLATEPVDLVTIDIRMFGSDGIELIRNLKTLYPSLPTLVITVCDESLYAERALKAGARGYVMKTQSTNDILNAMRKVLRGEICVSPKISALALQKMAGFKVGVEKHSLSSLTDRELQILQLLGAGLGSRQTAELLFLSIKTVESHRENIKHKLGLANAGELIRLASSLVGGSDQPQVSSAKADEFRNIRAN